ncbi:hypothetical protein [Paracoccus aminophilus]|uniref:Uncharacterized protein n=1 Tax=Paracoccus aminophilus JCM 7686 TaxID=1367847 RepID=S5Y022_PARAH|nr:hypothetical protein [Paracoccus aminophilus]AGT10892.1 hypothetical protein JCM7686_pAMI4p201 [Paracoccus aminophilus JCM 7686]
MVDIISKRDGPRREDERARRLIKANQGAITQIADHLTQGGYSASKRAQAQAAQMPPGPEGRRIYAVSSGAAVSTDSAEIRIKISVNNRVVAYDSGSGRQLHLLGEIRRQDGLSYFALASRENGFFAGLPDEVNAPIAELDGQIIDQNCPESLLTREISDRLGFS